MKYRESCNDKKLRKWFANDLSQQLLKGIYLKTGEIRGLTELSLDWEHSIKVG